MNAHNIKIWVRYVDESFVIYNPSINNKENIMLKKN